MSDSVPPRPRWFTANPVGHSAHYVERFRALADQGADLDGEARFVDTLAGRGSRVLDAGCGGGRVAGALHAAGHTVIGLDVDPLLVEAAETDHPGPSYAVADLSEVTLDDVGGEPVDVTVCSGNVMVFLAPGTEQRVLRNLCAVTRSGGRVVLGFRRDDAYPFSAFDDDLTVLARDGVADLEQRFGTWHLDPFGPDSDFAVTVLRVR